MYGFVLISPIFRDQQRFCLIDLPVNNSFKIFFSGTSHDSQISFMLEAEGSDEQEVQMKLDNKMKNLELYLNLYTNNKIGIKKQYTSNIHWFKKKYDESTGNDNIRYYLDSLKEPNLLNFVTGQITQQHIMLQTALSEIFIGDIFNGFPKLVNWLDENDGKGSSRFCSLRDTCNHGITNRAYKKVNETFPGEFEFEENILKRDSQKNMQSMNKYLPEVIDHVKKVFKRDFIDNL